MTTVDDSIVRDDHRSLGDPVARPALLIRVRFGQRRSPPIVALVDSGADVSTFHPLPEARLGIDPSACRDAGAVGVGGIVGVNVCAVELEAEGRRFTADVHFSDEMPQTLALRGRQDVFRQFLVGFDERAQRLFLHPYN